MIKVSEIFDVKYGHSLELNKLTQTEQDEGIPFVSRVSGNNGISAYVEEIETLPPQQGNVLTCALGGNGVMSVFLQKKPFYSGRDIACLIPKKPLTDTQMLFYCYCLNMNKFRYNYGRQANKTLSQLLVPPTNNLPSFVENVSINRFIGYDKPKKNAIPTELTPNKWEAFRFDEIFKIKKGYYNKKPPTIEHENEGIPFIGATENNNGTTSFISYNDLQLYSRNGEINPDESINRKLFPGRCITVSNNGSVGEAFYQPLNFTCSHDVNPLYLKDETVELNQFIGLFLCTIIRADKYRWGYGRKWRPMRMKESYLSLPVTEHKKPDWLYMENYIKSLPYSSAI